MGRHELVDDLFTPLTFFAFRLKAWEHPAQGDDALGRQRKNSQPEGLTAVVTDSRLTAFQAATGLGP